MTSPDTTQHFLLSTTTRRTVRVWPCGTDAAYRRHLRHEETPCAECRQAHADYEYARRAIGDLARDL